MIDALCVNSAVVTLCRYERQEDPTDHCSGKLGFPWNPVSWQAQLEPQGKAGVATLSREHTEHE